MIRAVIIAVGIVAGCGENFSPGDAPPVIADEDDYEDEELDDGSKVGEADQTLDEDGEEPRDNPEDRTETGESTGPAPTRSVETRYTFSGKIENIRQNRRIYGWVHLADDPFVTVEASIVVGTIEEPSAIIGPFTANKNIFDNGATGSHGFIVPMPKDLFDSAPRDLWLVVEYDGAAYTVTEQPFRFEVPSPDQ